MSFKIFSLSLSEEEPIKVRFDRLKSLFISNVFSKVLITAKTIFNRFDFRLDSFCSFCKLQQRLAQMYLHMQACLHDHWFEAGRYNVLIESDMCHYSISEYLWTYTLASLPRSGSFWWWWWSASGYANQH